MKLMNTESYQQILAVRSVRGSRLMLNAIMLGGGFVGMTTEWWHFELPMAQRCPMIVDGFAYTTRVR